MACLAVRSASSQLQSEAVYRKKERGLYTLSGGHMDRIDYPTVTGVNPPTNTCQPTDAP